MLKNNDFPLTDKAVFFRLIPIYRLMIGNLISFIGDQVYFITLPLIVYNVTGSVVQMGIVAAIEKVPNIFQPITGTIADMVNKKKLLLISDALRSILVCSMGFLYIINNLEMWHIYLGALLLGFFGQIYNTAEFSSIPLICEKEDLHFVNSLDSGIYDMAMLVGPSIGGLIINIYNPGYALLINGLSFLGTFLAVLSIHIPEHIVDTIDEPESYKAGVFFKKLIEDLRVSFKFVFNTPVLLYTNIALIFSAIGTTLFLTVMFFHFKSVLNLNAQEIGLLISIGGIGAILGSIVTNFLRKYLSYINIIIIGLVAGGISIITFGILKNYILLVLSNALGTFAVSLISPCIVTLRQSITPKPLLGRVQSTSRFMTWTLIPISAYFAGLLSNLLGTSITIVLGGIIRVVAAIMLIKASRNLIAI